MSSLLLSGDAQRNMAERALKETDVLRVTCGVAAQGTALSHPGPATTTRPLLSRAVKPWF